MKGLNYWVVGLVAIGALSLNGCGAKKEAEVSVSPMPAKKAAEQPAKTEKMSPPKVAGTAAAGSTAMLGVVKETKAAIKAGDFTQASEAFAKFEDSWKLIENGIKAKSPKAYDAIEENLDKIKSALKAKDATKANAALTSLETSLAVVK